MNKKSKFINAVCEECNNEILKEYLSICDEFVENVLKELALDNNFSYGLQLFNDREKYRIAIGKSKEEYKLWMIGNGGAEDKTIKILTPDVANRSVEYMLEVVKHELVHAIFTHYKIKPKLWINEGCATLFSGQNKYSKNLENPPSIIELEKDFTGFRGYTFSGVYIQYAISQNKKKFYEKLKKNQPFNFEQGFEEKAVKNFKFFEK